MAEDETEEGLIGAAVPLIVSPKLTVHLKFTMLSRAAQRARFGRVDGIFELVAPPPPLKDGEAPAEEDPYEKLWFLLGSSCLHEASGLEADLDGLMADTVKPKDEAARMGRIIAAKAGGMDDRPFIQALAEAWDNGAGVKGCHCGQRFSEHEFLAACRVCGCPVWHVDPAPCGNCGEDLALHPEMGPCSKPGVECAGFLRADEGKENAPAVGESPTTATNGASGTTSEPSPSVAATASSG